MCQGKAKVCVLSAKMQVIDEQKDGSKEERGGQRHENAGVHVLFLCRVQKQPNRVPT
jgi:hypothetical protein